jgi:hypothetical protein
MGGEGKGGEESHLMRTVKRKGQLAFVREGGHNACALFLWSQYISEVLQHLCTYTPD